RLQSRLAESEPDFLECGVLLPGHRLEPVEPVLVPGRIEDIALFDFVAAREQCRRARSECPFESPHGHLVEILVVEPDAAAVTDDDLLLRLVVFPAKFARTRELHGSGRL